jgi:acetyl esterase/lipase
MPVKTYTQEELSRIGTPSKALVEQMKQYPGPNLYGSEGASVTVDDVRKARISHLETRRPYYPVPGPIPELVEEKDVYVDYPEADRKIQIRVYCSTDVSTTAAARLPVIMLMHEGGWKLGDISDEEHNARLFASSFDCVVLNVEYLLTPEYPFPASARSCYHVLETLCSAPTTFHSAADPSLGIVVGGSSAGGNLSAVLAHLSRQNRLQPPVTGQWLGVPFITPTELVPAKYKQFFSSNRLRVDPIIDPGENEVIINSVYDDLRIKDRNDPLVSRPILTPRMQTREAVYLSYTDPFRTYLRHGVGDNMVNEGCR